MDLTIPIKLLIALLLGGFIGLEREYHKEEVPKAKYVTSSLGVRTFSLLTLLGALGGILIKDYFLFSLLLLSSVMLLVIANYVMSTIHTKDSGITTEIASIFAYMVGFMLINDIIPLHLTIALTVIATLILSRKEEIKSTISRLHQFETNAFITYAMIALVILPFLPDRAIRLSELTAFTSLLSAYNIDLGKLAAVEIINPYKLWLLIALITGIDMVSYFLNKYLGRQKGYLLSAVSGGFVSSTATTIALAQESRHIHKVNPLVSAAIFANTASFFQLILLLAPTNSTLLVASTIPLVSIIIAGIFCGFYFLLTQKSRIALSLTKSIPSEVFSLSQALKFAGIYLLIRFISSVALVFMGNSGVYITTVLGALVGLDAVILNLADLSARSIISVQNGVVAILLANAANLLAKVVYSFLQGSRAFTFKFALSMIIIIAASILGMYLF